MPRSTKETMKGDYVSMYGDTVRVKFAEKNHSYWVSFLEEKEWTKFERAYGATTYINVKDKPALIYWALDEMAKHLLSIEGRSITKYDIEDGKKAYRQRKDEAASIGTKVHDWMEKYALGDDLEVPEEDEVAQGVNAFLEWVEKDDIKFVEPEKLVYSREHGYCGSADAIIRKGRKHYLLDYKTSSGLYNGVMMQTAAYAKAVEEMGDYEIAGRYAVRLEKLNEEQWTEKMEEKGKMDAIYKPFECVYLDHDKDRMEKDYDAFLNCRYLHDWNKTSEKLLEEYKQK